MTEEFVHLADEHYARLRTLQEEMKKRGKQRGPSLHAKRLREIETTLWLSTGRIYRALPGIARLAAQSAPRQNRNGRGQPAPRHFDRQKIHQPRPFLPRPDPGRQHGPDEGGGKIRVSPRLQIFDLRDVVDSPGHHPLDCRSGAHHSHSGAHDRDDQQADAGAEAASSRNTAASQRRKKWRRKSCSRSIACARC